MVKHSLDIMFYLVVTTEAHLVFSGARTHSNNTAKITAMVFFGPRKSQHVAGVCLGTIQARTHVQLALACQQSMICAQNTVRLTMQHVYSHGGNLGNECVYHAAALGTFGFFFYVQPQCCHPLDSKIRRICVF